MNKKLHYLLSSTLLFSSFSISSVADDAPTTLPEVVEVAILQNPEVLQSFKVYEASVNDKEAAFGRFLPSVDLSSYGGLEERNDPMTRQYTTINNNFSRFQASIIVRQMLFDGFATLNEVERLDSVSRSKLLLLESTTQSIAKDSASAFIDLMRHRQIAQLAEDNYVSHKTYFEQLKLKADAGVGKRSDVEQAQSRLSLADYNMSVAGANLHDVEANYQRVQGNLPSRNAFDTNIAVNKDLPESPAVAVATAQKHNPSFLSTIQDTVAQTSMLKGKKAPFMPRFDVRAHSDIGSNINGYSGEWRDNAAEVTMNWSLFNGFTDYNIRQRELSLLEAAYDRRDKTCRDMRMQIEIAFNDIRKLKDQAKFLSSRVEAIEKTRDAYKKQFEIGQRTLLDLLNTENEMFEAKRLLINTNNDLSIAYVRTHFWVGDILGVLGLTKYTNIDASIVQIDDPDAASLALCPAEAPMPYRPNLDSLEERVKKNL